MQNNVDAAATEGNKGVRNFRSTSELEGFYRFVYENDIREEAKMVLSHIFTFMKKKNKAKKRRAKKLQ